MTYTISGIYPERKKIPGYDKPKIVGFHFVIVNVNDANDKKTLHQTNTGINLLEYTGAISIVFKLRS